MKKTKLIILLIIIVFILGATFYWIFRIDIKDYFFSQNVIYWNENTEINFTDYQGNLDVNTDNNLYYFHGFYLKANDVQSAYSRSYFDKTQSWVKDTMNYDFALGNKLQQIRFDIYEVYSRKYNKRIKELQNEKGTKYDDLTKVGDSLFIELNKEIDKLFGSDLTIEERIKRWRPKIDIMLNENAK